MKIAILTSILALTTLAACTEGPPYENGRERSYTDGRDVNPRNDDSSYYTGYNADKQHDHDRHTDDTWAGNNADHNYHDSDDGYYDNNHVWHDYN